MICPNKSNRGPLEEEEEKEKEKNKCGSLPTADIVGAVGKIAYHGRNIKKVNLKAMKIASRHILA